MKRAKFLEIAPMIFYLRRIRNDNVIFGKNYFRMVINLIFHIQISPNQSLFDVLITKDDRKQYQNLSVSQKESNHSQRRNIYNG